MNGPLTQMCINTLMLRALWKINSMSNEPPRLISSKQNILTTITATSESDTDHVTDEFTTCVYI